MTSWAITENKPNVLHESSTQLNNAEKFCTQCGSGMDTETEQVTEAGAQSARATLSEASSPQNRSEGSLPTTRKVMDSTRIGLSPTSSKYGKSHVVLKAQESQSGAWYPRPVLLYVGVTVLAVIALVAVFLLRDLSSTATVVTDAKIITSIQSKIAADPSLSKCGIEVKSQNGTVTLAGLVNAESERAAAAFIAGEQAGVKLVDMSGLVLKDSSLSGNDGPSSTSSTSSDQSAPSLEGNGSTSSAAVAPYIFNGAYGNYPVHYGAVTIPMRMTIHDVNPAQQNFQVTLSVSGALASKSESFTFDFAGSSMYLVSPSGLLAMQRRANPTLHQVRISVPAGSFLTEESNDRQLSAWYDVHTGVLVKMRGSGLAASLARDMPSLPKSDTAEIQLINTNVPSKL